MAHSERLAWLRLSRSENVGPITFRELLRRYGSATEALAALPDLARRGGRRRPLRIAPKADAEREIERAEAVGARWIAIVEPDYPAALAAVDDAPPLISALGHAHLMRREGIAIVGARNASAAGMRLAHDMAGDLGRGGLVVVSGLARGIDAAAHAGALATGTVAVLGGGIDVIYPAENEKLYREIAEAGLLVSETPIGTAPQARHFPRRNRIIAGMSLGVLVVEAALRSGSLITARLALEYGRDVFAVPGSPLDPRARGTNKLLREGAALTESAADVLDSLRGAIGPKAGEPDGGWLETPAEPRADDSEIAAARETIVQLLGATPTDVDELARLAGVALPAILAALLELELAGAIERHPGHKVSLTFNKDRKLRAQTMDAKASD